MRTVKPITNVDEMTFILSKLRKLHTRDYLVFKLALTTGLRISDILNLRVLQVRNGSAVTIFEKKVKKNTYEWLCDKCKVEAMKRSGKRKRKEFIIVEELYQNLLEFCKNKRDYEYIFKSRIGRNKAISRTTYYKSLNKSLKNYCKKNISSHVLRKTYAYFIFKSTNNIALTSKCLNHRSTDTTLNYINITQEDINNTSELINNLFKEHK